MSCFEKSTRLGLNFGYSGAADLQHSATDDAIFVNGILYKLDATIVKKINEKKWSFITHDQNKKFVKNSINLTFEIEDTHTIKENFIITKLDFKSNYGRVSGTFEYEGKKIEIANKFMIVEEMAALW